jgi:N-acetylglutamate synthase-like GNAT family acetyltransferase
MAESLIIRIAQTAEQKALEALQWRASLNNPGDRDALLANPDAIDLSLDQIAAGGVFVAERDGVIVGFAAVQLRADGQIELDGLFVEPIMWKCGVGRSLVEYCAEFARAQGAAALHVVGNPHAKNFYSACGFEVNGEHQTRFGVGLTMRKIL